MASPQKVQKPASRWGFLQQAVASVESRLDTILADEDPVPRKTTPTPAATSQPPKDSVAPSRDSSELQRNNSGRAANDRLQERLARAMAKKGGSRAESPMSPSESVSRTATPVVPTTADKSEGTSADGEDVTLPDAIEADQPKQLDAPIQFTVTIPDEQREEDESAQAQDQDEAVAGEVPTTDSIGLQAATPAVAPSSDANSTRVSIELPRDDQALPPSTRLSLDSETKDDTAKAVPEPNTEAAQTKTQDEINGFIERIDALQAKLQYLTKEAVDAAKQASASVQNGTAEKKLLEKDEKIALLMEEGQKLSVTEMKHLTTIKKLRTQSQSTNRDIEAAKARADKAEKFLRAMEDRAKKAEAANKRAEQDLVASRASISDSQAVRKERDALNVTLADIKNQLARANIRAETAEARAQTEQLEKERRKTAELQDTLTNAKADRELSEEKLKREIKDLKASLEREMEQTRAMETEMLGEQAVLESRLESFRARAEEASSGDHGDTQAKLLRQIETLQSQYAAASQNWQGIESSLLSRITNLEKERNDIATREGDVRKKLRESTLKTKSAERDLESANNKYSENEKTQADLEAEVHRLTRKAQQLEVDLDRAQKDLENQKSQAERDMNKKLEEERLKWAATLQSPRTDSPGTSIRRGLTTNFDMNYLVGVSHVDRGGSRRPSMLPGHDSFTPPRQYSVASMKGQANGGVPETPSIIMSHDPDEYFSHEPPTPASYSHDASRRGLNDIISTSTVGAGPSVQLVERMSANVRRLESEKASTKDELSRLTTQRDEARHEVVSLMREVEEKRDIDKQLQALRNDHDSLSQRHQTTLELLGEKSEEVMELKADIADVKQMYRQLADTMKG